ncbi:MAG TPA: hypothetical protein VGP72_00205 [Planctomycetota bacterium]|jgi:hypothetical protein
MREKLRSLWTINALLAVILALLCTWYFHTPAQKAYAAGGGWDTDGIMAVNTASDNERVVLINTKKQVIMIYKPQANKFRLVGARSFEYDVQIEDSEGTNISSGQGKTFMQIFQIYNELKNKK